MSVAATYARDRETCQKVGGVRTNPTHWASAPVHAHRTWTGQHTMQTWCGLTVNLEDGARQTRDLISCLACGQASYQAWWSLPAAPLPQAGGSL